jgi:broad specificity phosphatase PhoE
MAEVVLVRHGATEWSAAHRHTSYTDIDLTPDGVQAARDLAGPLASRSFDLVLASPRRRATRTAELAGLAPYTVDKDLAEWDYGEYEGLTTKEIREDRPGWYLWTDGSPGGESPEQVTERMDRVVARLRRLPGVVAVVGHAHALRALGARWLEQPITIGGHLKLDTATLSVLGYEREVPVILLWNAAVPASGTRTASTAPPSSAS